MVWLALALGLYAVFDWVGFKLMLSGFAWFCMMFVCLAVLMIVLGCMWVLDEGLGKVQDFLCGWIEGWE